MLEVQNLAVNYRGVRGLDSVSFRIEPGQFVGIVGPNGAGKSTMLKAMLGLIPAASGAVSYCTCPLHRQLQKVAYVPQRSQIDWDYPITARNVVMMARTRQLGWFRRPNRATEEIVTAALDRVEMLDLQHRRIGELSGGQQQRIFLARALAQQAEVFLFDEPFTGVDKKTEVILLQIFKELRSRGKILLVSSHDWGQGLMALDRLLLLNRNLIADGSPEFVMTPENLHRAYGTNLNVGLNSNLETLFFC
ncbi:ABC transporter ATP-binding protein [Oscillatoria sp. FACHB-1406]|uniref:metal ABC transporter ATP-binding protein n=1 Tax=Oscillatoria sp. FACHB-1406 TaxID=2692846 RepID=UPI001685A986|nr:ABC transporter ATP-binding protein [Oscillatoria sp. FACHB-1406]MBD2577299.1 ABC transporter ATP-binding protein [Oscillatoria sp. FACHB-1406]